MNRIERLVSKSSLGTKQAAAARATVSPEQAARVVARAAQVATKESSKTAPPSRQKST